MKKNNHVITFGIGLMLTCGLAVSVQAADEAERQVWLFRNAGEALAWNGNGPLPHGVWPVRDGRLQLTAPGKASPTISRGELLLPSEQANVVQIQVEPGNAKKCRLWFATDVSPRLNAAKMVEFDLKPDVSEYTLDLKALATWKNQVTTLRFDFLGAKEGDALAIKCIKVFLGEKISTPMVYTAYRPGEKPVVKEFRAGSLFSSNMVLQRERPLPVWGRAKPGEAVTVRFAGQTRNATTDASGKWSVTLDALPACGEARTMEISSSVAGHSLSFTNVVVGDVWLCGGQSNMGGSPQDNAPPAERRKELLETDYPNFRYVAMPGLHRETPLPNDAMEEALTWQSVQTATLRNVSAVSYYFGQSVHSSQKIPVGLVFVIKAGSQVEQWISRDTLRSLYSDEELQNISGKRLASGLHNGMVAPIVPFPLRGAIWYQGESNADNEFKHMAYYRSLPALVQQWRRLWGVEMPVLLVQLPAYEKYPTNSWAHIREAQLLASQRLSNVGLAVTFDEGDPTNLHPNNKYFIGARLGLVARSMVYGEKLESSGPIFTGMRPKGGELTLQFAHVAGGLKARGDLTNFEVRGTDEKWFPAKATIAGKDSVTVSSPDVPEPRAARYAWKNAPVATLFNDLGLPASPFRTDTPPMLNNLSSPPRSGDLPGIPADELAAGFRNPPDTAKPRTWWHWLNGNVTKEGITADLEAMKRIGLGGVQIIDGDLGVPQVVEKPAMYLTPLWLEMLRHAAAESERLGLELVLANCAGWSESGGPWVKPDQAMQKLVWSETSVTGPQKFSGRLALPPDVLGPFQDLPCKKSSKEAQPESRRYYADTAVIAFRVPAAAELPKPKVTTPPGKPQMILFEYPQPVTCRSLTIRAGSPLWELQAGDDGKTFRPVATFSGPRSHRSPETPKTIAFSATTARWFRLVVKDPKPVTIESVELSGAARLNRWEDKAAFALQRDYNEVPSVTIAEEAVVRANEIVNLTGKFSPDGQLDWDVPEGRWTILRIGHSPVGKKNHPAVAEGTGLECDKMSRAAVEAHFRAVLDKVAPVVGKGLQGILIDSWEADHQNWTPAFLAEFRTRRGYDPLPYLPAMTGQVIQSADVTERFLWDVRRTIADLLADHHYGTFQELCKARGLTLYAEAAGTGLPTCVDQLQCKGRVDIPMGEFWNANTPYAPIQLHHIPDCKEAASGAHIYGKPLAAAEAFTSGARHAPWGYTPFAEKVLGDRMFCVGINRFVFHTYAHQPRLDQFPGMTMGPFGIDFGRTLTWWDHGAAAWMSYLSRCQFLLQQGMFVADACYFYGEGAPATVGESQKLTPSLPAGYDYDICNAEVLLTRMSVKDGRLVLPDGMSYRVLVLPPSDRLTPGTLRKIRELVKAGAAVAGSTRPVQSPSLAGYPACDQEVKRLADELPIWGKPLALDVPPDFDSGGADLTFIHRRTATADIYFVSNQKYQPTDATCTFRVSDRAPEFWHPDTGRIETAVTFTMRDGRTIVPMHFDPGSSVFVVFRRPGVSTPSAEPDVKEMTVDGPWEVKFPPNGGAPDAIRLDKLISWTQHGNPGVKYFSGTAIYTREIEIPADSLGQGKSLLLDLGEVKEIAEVTLNGKLLGTLWKPPFRVEITAAAKAGRNHLEVQVTNLWPNRIIGDLNATDGKQFTHTVINPFKKNSPLLESGLLGPIRIRLGSAPASPRTTSAH